MNNAPFRVGQRVVCVDGEAVLPATRQHLKNGREYIVESSPYIGFWGYWYMQVSGRDDMDYRCDRFAPIAPRSIEIPESLKEQAEEMKDLAETIAPMNKELV